MTTKKCFKCNIEWPLIYFYKHPGMKDGHLNKCKKCTKKDVYKHREENIEKVREYDRNRAHEPHRKIHITENTRRWRIKNPEKYKAHCMVANALRSKALIKEPCCMCGELNVHAHHEDYSKPHDVMWLCALHHSFVDS